MKCLMKYQWVKLPRNQMPPGKGVMGAWARLASRAAFRNGQASYCGHVNQVELGSWVGGMVGFKSILGINRRAAALDAAERLMELGYIDFHLDSKSKKLTYKIKDWVVNCSGEPCMGNEAVYATSGYGFLCLPRNITQRLAEAHYKFDEADAWLDLWCHTVWQETGNAFSHIAPCVQYGRLGAILTLESLGRRWGWEKTKVWRFFRKHADAFPLFKLPGSLGCLVCNAGYPAGAAFALPTGEEIVRIIDEIRIQGEKTLSMHGTLRERMAKWICWFSRRVSLSAPVLPIPSEGSDSREALDAPASGSRVAVSLSFNTRAYLSPCENCKRFVKDCWVTVLWDPRVEFVDFTWAGAETGPPVDTGGIEYGRYEGDPLW